MDKGILLAEMLLTTIINDKTFIVNSNSTEIAKEALESVKALQKAFNKVCEGIYDGSCPNEHNLYTCEDCHNCYRLRKAHVDIQRDINCWKQYYLKTN